jgi:hypothetical protein
MDEYKAFYFDSRQSIPRIEVGIKLMANSAKEVVDIIVKEKPNADYEKIEVTKIGSMFPSFQIFLNPEYNDLTAQNSDRASNESDSKNVSVVIKPLSDNSLSTFTASNFVNFLIIFGWLSVLLAGVLIIVERNVLASIGCFGAAMSLFISAHVIKTIEKCAFYLENLNKK